MDTGLLLLYYYYYYFKKFFISLDVKITSVKNKVIIINIIFKPPDVSPGISKIQKEH